MKNVQKLFLVAALASIPFFSAFGGEPAVRVAVTDSKPAIREISKGAVGDTSSPETKKVRVIEIVSHAIESTNKTEKEEVEEPSKPEEAPPDKKEEVKTETESDDEGTEKPDDEMEEETFDDSDSFDDLKKKIAAVNEEIEEEPCECGALAEGECASCPDEESD